MTTHITYFDNNSTAWKFAQMLPKSRFEVIDYGKDENRKDEQFFVKYIDRPSYTR